MTKDADVRLAQMIMRSRLSIPVVVVDDEDDNEEDDDDDEELLLLLLLLFERKFL